MKALVVLAHPDQGSFNHALAHAAAAALRAERHEVIFHDLYAARFDPLLPATEIRREARVDPTLARHCRDLAAAEALVIVHPNWWGMPPAILTGWIDRVLRPDVAYRFADGDGGEGVPIGLLKAHAAVVLNTTNTAPEREAAVFGDPLEAIWRNCIGGLCGIRQVVRRSFGVICTSTLAQRQAWLDEATALVRATFPAD